MVHKHLPHIWLRLTDKPDLNSHHCFKPIFIRQVTLIPLHCSY